VPLSVGVAAKAVLGRFASDRSNFRGAATLPAASALTQRDYNDCVFQNEPEWEA
jgi:hypothetical protein